MRVDKIIDLVIISHRDTCPFLSRDGDKMCKHLGYDGGSKDKINRKRLIGNTYQIYRSILHQLAIDEDWNNVYSDITLPSGDMGTIKVERIDDDKKDNDIK